MALLLADTALTRHSEGEFQPLENTLAGYLALPARAAASYG